MKIKGNEEYTLVIEEENAPTIAELGKQLQQLPPDAIWSDAVLINQERNYPPHYRRLHLKFYKEIPINEAP